VLSRWSLSKINAHCRLTLQAMLVS